MSIRVPVDTIEYKTRQKIASDLEIRVNTAPNKFHYIYPYSVDDKGYLCIPFYYGINTVSIQRPLRKTFQSINTSLFEGIVRPEQQEVIDEATSILGKQGSVMISSYTGFGKCLAYNTDVLQYDGFITKVQNINVGHLLIGDDSKPRIVTSICTGIECMYTIHIHKFHTVSYTVNESHILSLRMKSNNVYKKGGLYHVLKWCYTKRQFSVKTYTDLEEATCNLQNIGIIDIPLLDYLSLPKKIQSRLYSFQTPIHFPYKECKTNSYCFGFKLISDKIGFTHTDLYNYYTNTRKIRENLLLGMINATSLHYGTKNTIIHHSLTINHWIVVISTSLCLEFNIINNSTIVIPNTRLKTKYRLSRFSVEPCGIKRYYGFTLASNTNGRFLLGDCTVTHNTMCSIKLATMIKLKTMILVNKIILMNQWKEAVLKFCPKATVTLLTSKSTHIDSDFYIINAQNVEKIDTTITKNIGCVILDEAHLLMTNVYSRALLSLYPRYLLGLSATPYRPDDYDHLINIYFGKGIISRKLDREHHVYSVTTNYKPIVEYMDNGKLNWNTVLDSISYNEARNVLLTNIICKYNTRVFLVLVKRIIHGQILEKMLIEKGESVSSLLGNNQEFDKDARILIGTVSKVGVGFDHPRMNTLLLAVDIEQYFIQYLGRVFRTKDTIPIVIDIVDNHSLLKKHYSTRKKVYEQHGGIITNTYLEDILTVIKC